MPAARGARRQPLGGYMTSLHFLAGQVHRHQPAHLRRDRGGRSRATISLVRSAASNVMSPPGIAPASSRAAPAAYRPASHLPARHWLVTTTDTPRSTAPSDTGSTNQASVRPLPRPVGLQHQAPQTGPGQHGIQHVRVEGRVQVKGPGGTSRTQPTVSSKDGQPAGAQQPDGVVEQRAGRGERWIVR